MRCVSGKKPHKQQSFFTLHAGARSASFPLIEEQVHPVYISPRGGANNAFTNCPALPSFIHGIERAGIILPSLHSALMVYYAKEFVDKMSSTSIGDRSCMNFSELDIPYEVKQGIEHAGFTVCTPVQEAVIPRALRGEDVAAQAQTGTGKTAAFLISLFTRMVD